MKGQLAPMIPVMIVPTGLGARQGGYGGDATPWMNLIASVSDTLITHPNVANAACFQKLPDNTLYVEGYGLDQFFKGQWALRPVRKNKLGVIFDAGMPPRMKTLHQNACHAVETVYGVEIVATVQTQAPLALACCWESTGSSSGTLANPDVLIAAGQELQRLGANAIAMCGMMPEITGESAYQSGEGPDPIGGIEAILSHLLVSQLGIPCAHAPVFSEEDAAPAMDRLVDPKTAAEFIVSTFLPCVLTGLSKAPQFIPAKEAGPRDILIDDVSALIVPANALGGIPVLEAARRGIPILTIGENQTVLNVTVESLGFTTEVIPLQNYLEAVGKLQQLRLGLA